MTGPAPVTVVVPTCNRRQLVADVVAALRRQDHADFQVVLVDDGSSDGTAAAARAAIGDDRRFRVLSTPNRGPAAARNAGCRAAATEWLAFTDDDCLPQPSWLAELLATAAGAGADVVQGRTVPDPGVRREAVPWFSRSQHVERWSGRFQTCNLLVRAACFRAVGGFDERFPPQGFGEDTDLGLRLVRRGAATAFAAGAVVHHRVVPLTYREFLRRRYRWGQVVRLVAVNPDARAVFPHRYVAHPAHAGFWAAVPVVAWALRTRRWALPVAGVVGYGVLRGQRSRYKGRGPLARTTWGASEAAGVAAGAVGCAVESARHRTLLL